MRRLAIVLAMIAVVTAGCTTGADYDPKIRRERLLAIYPLGTTSRDEVHKKWRSAAPNFAFTRPDQGWPALRESEVREHVLGAEARVKRAIFRCERYTGSDSFLSLCRCWFYYDANDRLADAEWQWMSD